MLKGLGALGDLGKLMGQAQELQQKMADVQTRLETLEVEGEAGAGMVRAVCTGKGAVVRVSIDPSLLGSAEDKTVVEDLVVAAVNNAQEKARERAQQEMASVTEGLPLPPGFGFGP
ncbi:MAG: YbaB/EbfC family nucleoid-associated protein [Pseudomonadota bacterium]